MHAVRDVMPRSAAGGAVRLRGSVRAGVEAQLQPTGRGCRGDKVRSRIVFSRPGADAVHGGAVMSGS